MKKAILFISTKLTRDLSSFEISKSRLCQLGAERALHPRRLDTELDGFKIHIRDIHLLTGHDGDS